MYQRNVSLINRYFHNFLIIPFSIHLAHCSLTFAYFPRVSRDFVWRSHDTLFIVHCVLPEQCGEVVLGWTPTGGLASPADTLTAPPLHILFCCVYLPQKHYLFIVLTKLQILVYQRRKPLCGSPQSVSQSVSQSHLVG